MESKSTPVTSQGSNAVTIAVMPPSSPAPLPTARRALNTVGGSVSGGAPLLRSLPSGQEPVMVALPVSQPLVGDVPVALPVSQGRVRGPVPVARSGVQEPLMVALPVSQPLVGDVPIALPLAHGRVHGLPVARFGGQEPVMIALPLSQPLVGDVPVALPLTHGRRVRGVLASRSGGQELVSGQPVPDLNVVPADTVEPQPPTSQQGLLNPNAVTLAAAPTPSQPLVPFNTVPEVTVAVAPAPTSSQSQGFPNNALTDPGNLMRCLRCYRAFAFSEPQPHVPGGLVPPPPGFPNPNPLTAPMPLSPPPASAISTIPFPVCSDPNHLMLTMQHARMDAAPELIWWRPPSFQPEHEDLVRISLGPPSSVDLDLGL